MTGSSTFQRHRTMKARQSIVAVELFRWATKSVRAETQEESRKGLKGRFLLYRGLGAAVHEVLLDLRLLRVCFVKSGAKPLRQFHGIIIGPKMHEIEMGLVEKHVIVHRLDLNAMRPQSSNDRINLGGQQDEITRDCGFTLARGLKVDRSSRTHGGRYFHSAIADLLHTRNRELQDASVCLSGIAKSLLDLRCLQVEGRLRSGGRRSGR